MPLISNETLIKAKKILFIAHLAIGDFTYLQNFFKAFAQAYPDIDVDLWIDEVRCTSDSAKWESLKKYSLYDWTEHCRFFRKIYRRTYSPQLLQESILEAQNEQYPIIISLATLRPYQYATLARTIGPSAFIVGNKGKSRWYAPWDQAAYAKLDATFTPFKPPAGGYHITAVYADWFNQLCNLQLSEVQRFPFIDLPKEWIEKAQQQLQTWGVTQDAIQRGRKIVFINTFAKTKKRCWPLNSVAELIIAMRKLPAFSDTTFVVNAIPQELANATSVLASHHLQDTHLFSAEQNFFQLPALLQQCDLIISVETAVMHLANAVHVPVIALMRQKNPEWVPIDKNNSIVITTARRREWVKAISVEQILKVI